MLADQSAISIAKSETGQVPGRGCLGCSPLLAAVVWGALVAPKARYRRRGRRTILISPAATAETVPGGAASIPGWFVTPLR